MIDSAVTDLPQPDSPTSDIERHPVHRADFAVAGEKRGLQIANAD
jgi:hypothetical protein